jgi:hypothetical protein
MPRVANADPWGGAGGGLGATAGEAFGGGEGGGDGVGVGEAGVGDAGDGESGVDDAGDAKTGDSPGLDLATAGPGGCWWDRTISAALRAPAPRTSAPASSQGMRERRRRLRVAMHSTVSRTGRRPPGFAMGQVARGARPNPCQQVEWPISLPAAHR